MGNSKSFSYKDRKYSITPYDSNWQVRFADESEIVRNIFGHDICIEHIGSTSVPGMAGKPCIDVLAVVKNLEIVRGYIADMEQAGYTYIGAFVVEDALLFSRMENNELQANIHFFPEGHPNVYQMLLVRDYLRTHPEDALQYASLKQRLYERYPNDYAGYRREKDVYMEQLIQRAKHSHH